MRILFIANGYPPLRWAGTETYTAGLAEGFQKLAHQVQVLCAGEWETGPSALNGYTDALYKEIPVRRLDLNWKKAPDPFANLYNNRFVSRFLKKYVAQLKPDLVHVTSCETLSASVLEVVKGSGLPLVLSLTDFWFLCPRISLLRSDGENCDGLTTNLDCLECMIRPSKAYRWTSRLLPGDGAVRALAVISRYPQLTRRRGLRGLMGDMGKRKAFLRKAFSFPDCRLTASRFVQRAFSQNGFTEPIRWHPYGHSLDWMTNYNGKTPSDILRVGFIGQIIERKGVHVLLQATRTLYHRFGERFSIQIYGNLDKVPSYGATLRELAENLPNVHFKGTYQHQDSARVFAGMDVLVVPSLWYDFPLIIHEAFATSTPVIATNLAGMAEAVKRGVSGLLFRRDSATDLARQLQRLIDQPELYAELVRGIPQVKTVGEEIAELEKLYKDLL